MTAILALQRIDSCAIAGRAKLTSWETDSAEKHGLSVVADRVMNAYPAGKPRKTARECENVSR